MTGTRDLRWPTRVETARIVIRPVDERDLDDLAAVNGDDRVTAYLPYATWRTRDDADAWLARMRGLEAEGRSRQYVVVDRSDDRAIGVFVLFHYEHAARRAEIGYALGRAHWGRGLLRESLPAFVARAFEDLDLVRIEAYADSRNVASHRLLVGSGFTHEGTLRKYALVGNVWADSNVYGLLREEATASSG